MQTNSPPLPRRLAATLLTALLAFPAAAAAQGTATLPPAKDVIARYVAAIGGADAVMKRKSIRSTGTFEMPATGLKGDLVIIQTKDKLASTVTIPGMGEMVSGFDGTHAWAINPMQGPRLLEGKELQQTREGAGFASILRASPDIKSMETVERTEMGGRPCYKLKITYASGRESFECYDTETGLLVGSIASQESAMGTVEVVTLVSEWKDFGGFKSATSMKQQMMGMEQMMTITNIEFDRPDDARAFEMPAPVKALVEQKNQPAKTGTP